MDFILMKCALIGRVKKHMTGLGRVSALWKQMLENTPNWSVEFMGDKDINWSHVSNADLVMLGGDSSVNEEVYKKIRLRTKSPILSLSLFRNSSEDRRDLDRLKDLNAKFNNVYFVVWDDTFYSFDRFDAVRDHILTLPKPILINPRSVIPYSKRSGICIGQTSKTFNPRFVSRSAYDDLNDTKSAISRLVKEFKSIEFYSYGPDSVPVDDVRVISPGHKMVSEFLPSLRIFISFQTNETFYLVPIEAQSSGTPVLYRHAPQSLTPYVGFSGLKVQNIDDLKFYIEKLYFNEDIWNHMSKCSLNNAHNVSHNHRFMTMGLILENFIKFRRR
jgi:glycosyltransferase involved in cell wall biosynthesis